MKNNVANELTALFDQHGGILPPKDIVAFAADPLTALHSEFCWDDNIAANEHRLNQARRLLRVWVTFEPSVQKHMRVAVSLQNDREAPGGGYRLMVHVMSDSEKREQLLKQALDQIRKLQQLYGSLGELAGVFAAAEQAKMRLKRSVKLADAQPATTV